MCGHFKVWKVNAIRVRVKTIDSPKMAVGAIALNELDGLLFSMQQAFI